MYPITENKNIGGYKMPVVKIVNLLGSSTKDWGDAVNQAVTEASKTIDNITGVEVLNTTAAVRDGKIIEYKANVNVAFAVDSNRSSS